MIEAAETALGFVAERTRSDLDTDTMLRFALVRAIEVIGEAASKMSESAREASPDIPWRHMVSMRNRLIHGYFDIDREILWKTLQDEIPELLPHLRNLIDNNP